MATSSTAKVMAGSATAIAMVGSALVGSALFGSAVIGSATAAEVGAADLKAFVSGRTLYLETNPTSAAGVAGKGFLYYGADGNALYKTPANKMLHGTWVIKDNTVCTNWKEVPNNGCVKYDKEGDGGTVIDVTTGKPRATILKSAAGNPENLAP